MRASLRNVSAGATVALLCLAAVGCGSKVKGNTYEEGPISIAFQSGGKATFASGPIGTDCTYTESGSKVTLNCGPQTMLLAVNDDGSLTGPAESGLDKLVKRK